MVLPTFDSGKILALAAGVEATRTLHADTLSFNQVCAKLQELRSQGVTSPLLVKLSPERYTVEDGNFYAVSGVIFDGSPGTEIVFQGENAAKVVLPDMAGHPTTKTITTGCLGVSFRGDAAGRPKLVAFRNVKFLGLVSTPAAAGHYYLLGAVGTRIAFEDCEFENHLSETWDNDAADQSPYLGLAERNCTSLTLFYGGEDRRIEPDVEQARPCGGVFVSRCRFEGEPLDETGSSAAPRLNAVWLRKCGPVIWEGNQFGEVMPADDRTSADFVLSANPLANDTVLVYDYNPYAKTKTIRTYTFAAAESGAYDVLIGADAAATILNLVRNVNENRIQVGGTNFLEALPPSQYLGSTLDGTAKACRIQTIDYALAGLPSAQNPRLQSYLPISPFMAVGVDVGGVMTVRHIHTGDSRPTNWMYGLVLEDCFGGTIGETSLGADRFLYAAYKEVATGANLDFTPNPYSESGHHLIRGWTGELGFYGNAVFELRSAGFLKLHDCAVGLGTLTDPTVNPAVIKIGKGSHASATVTMTGQPQDTGIVTIVNDGHGGSRVFEWDNNSTYTAGRTPVTIGSSTAVSIANLRNAIQTKFDDGTITCYAKEPVDAGGGTYTMEIVFVTWLNFTATPSVTEASANLTVADTSSPYLPRYIDLDVTPHAMGNATNNAVPLVWAEFVAAKLTVRGALNALRAPEIANLSQAVSTVVINSVPADNSDLILDSIAAGGPGTATTFRFMAGGGVDADPLYFIDTTVNNTVALCRTALIAKVATAEAVPRSFAATALAAAGTVRCVDGTAGVNAALLTKAGGDSGASLTITTNDTGDASEATAGYHYPIVLKDVAEAAISVDASAFTDYSGLPFQIVYVEKTGAGVASKVVIDGCHLFGAMGLGRKTKYTLVNIGPNMVDGDVIAPTNGNYVNGAAV